MTPRRKQLEPRQERSRESLRKLLKAAAEVLGQHGVEGTTIPRIARHAGLTPGAVYRRFHDKDALLETAILGILERQDERVRTGITPAMASRIPLPVLIEQSIGGMVTTYRMNASLLRAMRQFVQSRAKTPFCRKAGSLEARSFARVVDLFLCHRDEIAHPDPRRAISLGLMMVVATLFDLVVMPTDVQAYKSLLPKDDQALKRELVRAFTSYLGLETGNGRPPVSRKVTAGKRSGLAS